MWVNALNGGGSLVIPRTMFLSHFDGSDASTTFTDEAGSTITPSGDAQIDTAQSVFGGASVLLDGSGDYLTVSGAFAPTEQWTVEGWFRPQTFSRLQILLQHTVAPFTAGSWRFLINTSSKLNFAAWNSSAVAVVNITGATTLSVDTWYHYAISRNGDNWYLAVGGVIDASVLGADIGAIVSSGNIVMGRDLAVPTTRDFQGHFDEHRVIEADLYTQAYTVPPKPFGLYGN